MVFTFNIKAKAIYQFAKYGNCRNIARSLGCSKSSVCNWAKKAQECLFNFNDATKRYDYKINNSVIDIVRNCFNDSSYLKLKDVKEIIQNKLNISISKETVRKILKKCNISRKRSKRFVVKSKDYYIRLQLERDNFIKNVNKIENELIISIDESAFHKEMQQPYGYSKKGIPVIQTTTSQRHEKYSLLMAITNNRILSYQVHKGSINKNIYNDFIINLISLLDSNNKYYLMMDNVRFHHNKILKEYMSSNINEIIYTPPYSPELNPVEMVFSIIKHHFKQDKNNTIYLMKKQINNIITSIKRSFNNLYKYSFNLDNHNHYKIIVDRFLVN